MMSSRPLSSLEHIVKVISDGWKHLDREHWAIYTALQLKFPYHTFDQAACLRRAWQVARYHYPALGAMIVDADETDPQSSPMLVSCLLSLDDWAHKTFSVEDYQDSHEFLSSVRPMPTASCYWIPASSELVIRTPHWLIDGLGLLFLSRKLMTALEAVIRLGVDAPLEAYLPNDPIGPTLPPSIDLLSNPQQDPRVEKGVNELFDEFLRCVPSIGFPTRSDSLSDAPGPTARVASHLDAETTSKIVEYCRKKNIKVTSAVHAAIVHVTASFPQHPLAKAYAMFALANLRHASCAGPAWQGGDPKGIVALCFASFPMCISGVVSGDGEVLGFDDMVKQINRAYTSDWDHYWDPRDGSGQDFALIDLAPGFIRRFIDLAAVPLPDGFPPVQTPDLSSLGRVDPYLPSEYGPAGDIKVEISSLWMGTETLTRNIMFHVWTWKGELNLGACFNTNFYEKSFVSEIVGRVLQELVKNCVNI